MRQSSHAGFTLVELMIVVAIFSVLLAVAGTAYRKYMDSGRTAEVYAMLGELRSKEEAFRAENATYLGDTVDENDFYPVLLAAGEPAAKTWAGAATPAYWTNLGVNPGKAQLYCGYVVIAGPGGAWNNAGTNGKNIFNNTAPAVPWWYANATCDNDGRGAPNATFTTSSATTTVVTLNEHK
jgi:prepilin-type N-terminal cleavage/methylation domain-containing protein